MKEKVVTLYVSDDGTEFTSRTKCEARDKEIKQEFNQKVNDFKIVLRDDAVEFLFNYIDELEQEVKDTKRELSEVEQKLKKEKQKAKSKKAE